MSDKVNIIEYSDDLSARFRDLNLVWLEKHFVIEPIDAEMLNNPRKFFIDKGGYIFFAECGDEIVGTFALIREEEGVFELSKMAVLESWQGKKIGNRMLEFCLEKAKELQAKKIMLYSNTKLEPAIHLYRKYGFREVPIGSSEYRRSNIKMEIIIN